MSRRKRIMFMVNNLYGGGAERILQTILGHLDYSKYDITLYCIHQTVLPESLRAKVKLRYIFNHGIGKGKTILRKYGIYLSNKIKLLVYKHLPSEVFYRLYVRGKYDVEVAFIEGYSTRIVSGSSNPDSKKLAWVHIDMIENHWSSIAYQSDAEEVECYHKFDTVACVSEVVRESVVQLFQIRDKATVVYNPVDECHIIENSKEIVEGLDKSKAFRFISLGRLEPQKGYDRLIPIISKLRENGHDVELWILGRGSQYSFLQQQISEYGLEGKVKLLGFQSNPYAYFKYCDAFVCSSRNEGYSTAVTEALILGMPVVSTLCSGTIELLGENSEYGIVTDNNEESLLRGMEQLLDCNNQKKYKIRAMQRGQKFCLKELMSQFEKIMI